MLPRKQCGGPHCAGSVELFLRTVRWRPDATCAGLMGLDPRLISHIEDAGRFLGNMDQNRITMLAEGMPRNIEPFRMNPPVSASRDQGMRSALEHGQEHFGYAARGAVPRLSRRGSAAVVEIILVARQRCEGAHPIGGNDVKGQKRFGRESLQVSCQSDTPRGAGGLMSWVASKAVELWV